MKISDISPCSCLGAMHGEPFCQCKMEMLNLPRSEEHKIHVAETMNRLKQVFFPKTKDDVS